VAILVSDLPAVNASLARIRDIDSHRLEAGERPTGLLPFALDARNSVIHDEVSYREASAALVRRDDVPPELETRLQAEVLDDPLYLANRRLHDARVRRWGRIANALVEPVGRSITSASLLPYRLFQGILGAALAQHQEDELTAPERQALEHWKQFIERHPDSPEAARLLDRVNDAQLRWIRTQRDQTLRRGRDALEKRDAPLAAALAERTLRYSPEDPDALELLIQAEERGGRWVAQRNRSLAASAESDSTQLAERELLVALLAEGDARSAAKALLEADPDSPLEDEVSFVLATEAGRRGEESHMWKALEKLGSRGDESSNMARHARALLYSTHENPYRAFEEAESKIASKKRRWLAFGPLVDGPRDRDLPRPVEWLVEIPASIGVLIGLPNRIVRYPFMKAHWDVPAIMARRYLEHYPEGEHAGEMRDWLRDFEATRGNFVGALRFAEAGGETDEDDLESLRTKASEQALQASLREPRRDVRRQLLREVARAFRGTDAAQEAGEILRLELEQGSPQHIRISRQFMKENPAVVGPGGLALRPGLLDGENANGELHPDGVTLLGGRWIEFAFLAESGRDGKPPERVRREVSEERLARTVAQLEESALYTARVDRDAVIEHDADRDLFFERVRLGVVDEFDRRPHAESTYTFLGMRERYGLVRSRESILPFEIVLQGSFDDFGMGAFPRVRMPKDTPDVFLFK